MYILAPLTIALLFNLHLISAPPVTRGPEPAFQSDEIPEWLKKAVEEQSRHSQDNTMLMVGVGTTIAINVITLMAIVFKGGAIVKQVEINTSDIRTIEEKQDRMESRIITLTERTKGTDI